MRRLFQDNETFRGRVRPELMRDQVDAVRPVYEGHLFTCLPCFGVHRWLQCTRRALFVTATRMPVCHAVAYTGGCSAAEAVPMPCNGPLAQKRWRAHKVLCRRCVLFMVATRMPVCHAVAFTGGCSAAARRPSALRLTRGTEASASARSAVQVEAAGSAVVAAVSSVLEALLQRSRERDTPKVSPCVVHDKHNNAVWLHVFKGSHVRPAICSLP